MTVLSEDITIPENLMVADATHFKEKLAEFAGSGAAGMHIIFDFDRTLTVKKPGTHDEVTTWHILHEHLPEDGQAEYQKLFEKYRPLELSGDMSRQDAIDWWSSILNLFVRYEIDLAGVEEIFLERASIRPGTAELFRLCATYNVPTVILSAGIREVIEIWCRKYDIHPSLIVATALTINGKNKISGWKEETLVHALNKSEATHPELLSIRTKQPKAMLVGDSLNDASMSAGEQDTIRVRILDPRADEFAIQKEEQKTFEQFDALIKVGSLYPLVKLTELIF